MRTTALVFAIFAGLGGLAMPAYSDEGMWLLNEPPTQILRDKYKFDLTPEWLENARLSSIRFSRASASFISPEGLIITNHHVGSDTLQKLSTKDRDLLKDGFTSKKREDELKCPDLEIFVLQEIVDVTKRTQ